MVNKIKVIFSIVFFVIGICCTYLTYDMQNMTSRGDIKLDIDWGFKYGHSSDSPSGIAGAGGGAGAGSGVDSSNDGVATGLGIIAGFSLLASALLIASLKESDKIEKIVNKKDEKS